MQQSGKHILQAFSKSIGKLEHFIQTLETNVGVLKSTSPLVSNFGASQSELDNLVNKEQKKKIGEQLKSNENMAFYMNEIKEKEQAQVQEKVQEEQKQTENKKEGKQKKPQSAAPKEAQVGQKKQKKQEQPNQQNNDEFEPTVQAFYELDIRVGHIVEVSKHPDSAKLYCEKIDVGEGELRSIASGLQQFIPIENMTGLCLVVTNLKPMKLAGFESNGMVLCTSSQDKSKVELLRPPTGSMVGERVTLEGNPLESTEKPAILNPKKKQLIKILPFFKSDSELFATYNNIKWTLPSGCIQAATISNGQIA